MTVSHDIARLSEKLMGVRQVSSHYEAQRDAGWKAIEAVSDFIIEAGDTLCEEAGAPPLSDYDRKLLRNCIHDAFVDAICLAEERNALAVAAE